jgi:hypothetical protein
MADDLAHISSTSESMRMALALYMLTTHGPTYFSHAHLQHTLVSRLRNSLEESLPAVMFDHTSLALWLLAVGLTTAHNIEDTLWYSSQVKIAAEVLGINAWEDILPHLKQILWFEQQHTEDLFRRHWEQICAFSAE